MEFAPASEFTNKLAKVCPVEAVFKIDNDWVHVVFCAQKAGQGCHADFPGDREFTRQTKNMESYLGTVHASLFLAFECQLRYSMPQKASVILSWRL